MVSAENWIWRNFVINFGNIVIPQMELCLPRQRVLRRVWNGKLFAMIDTGLTLSPPGRLLNVSPSPMINFQKKKS